MDPHPPRPPARARAGTGPYVLVDRVGGDGAGCSVSVDDVVGGSLADRPTAVFCANDLLALGVLQALYAAGVRVPEDMAIVGYDDIEFAAATVPLTSVRQPALTLGARAAELLLEETGEAAADHRHQQVVLQPELVVRRSTLAPR